MQYLGALLANLLGGGVASLLLGAGMAVTTYAVSKPLVMSALDQAAGAMSGMGGDILQVALIAGLGEVLSILGSAIATRLGISAGRVALTRARR